MADASNISVAIVPTAADVAAIAVGPIPRARSVCRIAKATTAPAVIVAVTTGCRSRPALSSTWPTSSSAIFLDVATSDRATSSDPSGILATHASAALSAACRGGLAPSLLGATSSGSSRSQTNPSHTVGHRPAAAAFRSSLSGNGAPSFATTQGAIRTQPERMRDPRSDIGGEVCGEQRWQEILSLWEKQPSTARIEFQEDWLTVLTYEPILHACAHTHTRRDGHSPCAPLVGGHAYEANTLGIDRTPRDRSVRRTRSLPGQHFLADRDDAYVVSGGDNVLEHHWRETDMWDVGDADNARIGVQAIAARHRFCESWPFRDEGLRPAGLVRD